MKNMKKMHRMPDGTMMKGAKHKGAVKTASKKSKPASKPAAKKKSKGY
jgi:hypothetical protein